MKKSVFLTFVVLFFVQEVYAQCAMCKAVAEDKANEVGGSGVNAAIIYVMVIPYIILGAVAIIAFRKKIFPFLKDLKNAKG